MRTARPEDWYETRHVGDDVTHIHEPYIKEFYRCNIWHVRGRDKDMLVDTGMGVVSLREQISLLTERSCIAVASHTHFDHIGSHHEFVERVVHVDEAALMASPTRANTLADPYVTDDMFTRLPLGAYRSTEYAVKAAPATRIVADGDVIDLGDRHFEVMHTPGHSPGEIMLWEEGTGILFSGDTVYDGPLLDDSYHADIAAYVKSMKRILDLPVRIVHGGHFPSFGGERYRELILAYLREKDR